MRPAEGNEQWADDCYQWRDRLLTGRYRHWCPDWDELPINETCEEWPCACAPELQKADS